MCSNLFLKWHSHYLTLYSIRKFAPSRQPAACICNWNNICKHHVICTNNWTTWELLSGTHCTSPRYDTTCSPYYMCDSSVLNENTTVCKLIGNVIGWMNGTTRARRGDATLHTAYAWSPVTGSSDQWPMTNEHDQCFDLATPQSSMQHQVAIAAQWRLQYIDVIVWSGGSIVVVPAAAYLRTLS